MTTPSRRQFVATLAAVPFLPQIASAQRSSPARTSDPVLDRVVADLRELDAEFKAHPGSRRSTMRAMESTLGIGAAHLAAHYDADFRAAVRRARSRRGRAVLTEDVVAHARRAGDPNVTHESVDAAMARYEQLGLSGCFRDVQQTVRKVRLQAPEQIQAARAGMIQFDYCADLNWAISHIEGIAALVCAIAVLEPTFGGEIPCAALTLVLGLLLVQRSWFC